MLNKKNRKRFHMYSANAISFVTLDLARYSEIPESIHNDHVGALKALMYANRYLIDASEPQEKFLLTKKMSLISKEASYVASRLKRFAKINLINLHESGLNESLELITPLLEQGRLGRYVMAGQSDMINDQWANSAQIHASRYNTKLETKCLKANFDIYSYKSALSSLAPVDQDSTNLFFMGESSLGNYLEPARILKNIYDSMNCGDYLVLSQDLYNPGTEKFWVGNYINFLAPQKNFAVTKEFANDLSQDCPIEVTWEEKNGFRGVKFRVEIQEPIRFANVDLQEKQKVDIFRSTRFTELELKKMIFKLDFRIVQILYGDNMDNALFVLQKV
jgi:uncharacterized SAM-dependent methyltransferase